MSTPLGQLDSSSSNGASGTASAKAADIEMIESQLMNNNAASLPNSGMGAEQAPRVDTGALPTATPQMAFPAPPPQVSMPVAPMGGAHYAAAVPPAMPPPARGSLDDYAFPISIFILSLIVLSPYIETAMRRFLPAYFQSPWAQVLVKAGLITAGFLVLDKLNQ
jgi:hypothetical protein